MSTQPCGCDLDARWMCRRHSEELQDRLDKLQDGDSRNEAIVTDPDTGGRKASKLARFDLIPPEAEWALAEHYGKGCAKYESRNWEKGYKWGLSLAALRRHLNLWHQGESYDEETGSHHLIAVAWHAFALFTYELRGLGTDDVRVK